MSGVRTRPDDHWWSHETSLKLDSSSTERREVHNQRFQLQNVKSLFAFETKNIHQECIRGFLRNQHPISPGRH